MTLPFPHKALWPNGRPHWAQRHREFKKHKQWAFHAALAANLGEPPERVEWLVTFYPKTRHKIDADNASASLKAYADGIAAAWKVNDQIFAAPRIQFGEPERNGRVVVSLDPA